MVMRGGGIAVLRRDQLLHWLYHVVNPRSVPPSPSATCAMKSLDGINGMNSTRSQASWVSHPVDPVHPVQVLLAAVLLLAFVPLARGADKPDLAAIGKKYGLTIVT